MMYIFIATNKNYSSDVRDSAQYKTNSDFVSKTLFSECACDTQCMPNLYDSVAITRESLRQTTIRYKKLWKP